MIFRILIAVCLLLAAPVNAECTNRDLIAALPAHERATLTTTSEAIPFHKGLLWRATKDDTRLTVFGTYHLLHEATERHLAQITPYLDAADIVFLEMNLADTEAFERRVKNDPSLMVNTDGPTLPELLSEEDWQMLSDELRQRSIPPFFIAKMKPIWVSFMLAMPTCSDIPAAQLNRGIDRLIAEYIAGQGYDNRSLDDAEALVALFNGFSLREQTAMITSYLRSDLDINDMMFTLLKYYKSGDSALIWEFNRLLSLQTEEPHAAEDFDTFARRLLHDRNAQWVATLLQDAIGTSSFIAVGAAHLPGDAGVLQLLQDQDFTITAMAFEGEE